MRPIFNLFLITLIYFSGCTVSSEHETPSRLFIVLKDVSLSIPASEDSLDKAAIGDLLNRLVSGDEIVVLSITANSFANPQPLLQERLPADNHPLQANLLQAREDLCKTWAVKAQGLKLHARQSDVVGSLHYAQELLEQSSAEKFVIIFSDLRHSSATFNFIIEKERVIDVAKSLHKLEAAGLLPPLNQVKVACLGVHTSGKGMTPGYYRSLKEFWRAYFASTQAELITLQTGRSLDWLPAGNK